MQSDMQVLRERIARIESVVGSGLPQQSSCLHVQMQHALNSIRKHIPDEIVAARHALDMISYAAPGLRGLSAARQARVEHAEAVVDRVVKALVEMDTLERSMTIPGNDLPINRGHLQKLDILQQKVMCEAEPQIESEEQRLDRVLVDFNDATLRLNHRILAMANKIKGMDS